MYHVLMYYISLYSYTGTSIVYLQLLFINFVVSELDIGVLNRNGPFKVNCAVFSFLLDTYTNTFCSYKFISGPKVVEHLIKLYLNKEVTVVSISSRSLD